MIAILCSCQAAPSLLNCKTYPRRRWWLRSLSPSWMPVLWGGVRTLTSPCSAHPTIGSCSRWRLVIEHGRSLRHLPWGFFFSSQNRDWNYTWVFGRSVLVLVWYSSSSPSSTQCRLRADWNSLTKWHRISIVPAKCFNRHVAVFFSTIIHVMWNHSWHTHAM